MQPLLRNVHLPIHKRTHIDEKTFECSHCDKTFSLSMVIVINQRTHTGEKLFQCSHCDKSFSNNSILVIHHRTHTGGKPFQCNHCDKAFVLTLERSRWMHWKGLSPRCFFSWFPRCSLWISSNNAYTCNKLYCYGFSQVGPHSSDRLIVNNYAS